MCKAMITKAFVGSLVGFAGAAVLFLMAGGPAVWNDLNVQMWSGSDQTPSDG